MLSGSLAAYTILAAVRDACVTALSSNAPARVSIVPGAIAWDNCDDCGVLALASTRNYLSDQFPNETVANTAIGPMPGAILCTDMVVQIIRCAPQPQQNQLAPSVSALDASAQVVIADAVVVLCTVIATLTTMQVNGDIEDFLIRQQPFVGPEGACVGSELQFVVGVIR
jgi:hypothetical protein